MRFVLHYRGSLRSGSSSNIAVHKHDLRKEFHRQLARLWAQDPLNRATELLQPAKEGAFSSLRSLGSYTFVPLATEEMKTVAELEVHVLRPEPPGSLLTQGGDIDNRLKTLFDSLTMPRHLNQLPSGVFPTPDETPFFSLLEDDNLVTSVTVHYDQLLEPVSDSSQVDLTVRVQIRALMRLWGNWIFT